MTNVKMEDFGISASDCTGCAACANICEKDAIQMTESMNGFKYPIIDMEKCIRCMKCLRICKSRKSTAENLREAPIVYAMRSKDDELRRHSTSGGIFSELAQCVLNRSGSVVGAIYVSDHSAEHCMIHDLKDLESIRRSKYQQSNINLIYREVKAALDDKKDVLFCGTPCQVAGLKAFLGNISGCDNLYTCDFICRGVSSPKIFGKYIENLKNTYGSAVEYVWMKNKCMGWHSLTTVIGFENGETYVKTGLEDSYVQMYLKYNAGVRESCYECQFKGENDVADITLGDFWGLEGTEADDNLGTSVVICRTQKGVELVNEIKEHVFCQKKQMEDVAKGNPCLYSSIEKRVSDSDMNMFYYILEREGYRQAVRLMEERYI